MSGIGVCDHRCRLRLRARACVHCRDKQPAQEKEWHADLQNAGKKQDNEFENGMHDVLRFRLGAERRGPGTYSTPKQASLSAGLEEPRHPACSSRLTRLPSTPRVFCCGVLTERKQHACVCARCRHQTQADANAAMSILDRQGLCCPPEPDVPVGGPYGPALNLVR